MRERFFRSGVAWCSLFLNFSKVKIRKYIRGTLVLGYIRLHQQPEPSKFKVFTVEEVGVEEDRWTANEVIYPSFAARRPLAGAKKPRGPPAARWPPVSMNSLD